jgi:dTDP-4-dehydrorhamnose reductase
MEVSGWAWSRRPEPDRVKLLVTGRDGQVARSLAERAAGSNIDLVNLGRPEFDLAEEPDLIVRAVRAVAPDAIVSAAAYTAVDQAESEPDLAFAINERGAGALAKAARELGVPLIHLSTDYVFEGGQATPYVETDPTGPTSVYGRSKLAGEAAILSATDNAAILRTAWVYSPFGRNFVKTMLRLAAGRDEVQIVADQLGNPTNALDIATGIIAVAHNLVAKEDAELRGIFHMTASGEASWADFASAIFDRSAAAGGSRATVKPITTADFPTPAKRPANSRLNCAKLADAHGVALKPWTESLTPVVERLVAETQTGIRS